jgi:hypothetical protein
VRFAPSFATRSSSSLAATIRIVRTGAGAGPEERCFDGPEGGNQQVAHDQTFAPVAITGMHRSGTSMITRALHDSGLHLIGSEASELIDAAEDNPEGFWENKAIVACNDELLEATGGSWDNPPDFPPHAVDDPRVADIAAASTAAITALSVHDHWGFKDPRLCLTAAYWLDLVPDLRFIVCVRHPLEVALSLKRRNQNSYSLGLALWERYYATVLDLLPPERVLITHYDTFFTDPEGEVARLCAFADLTPAPPRVRTDLRHHTIGVGLADAGASPSLRALYTRLCRDAGAPAAPDRASDEGRVRRLVLDGAVATRHAEQRQAEIERLEETNRELRERINEMESAHRVRVRDLEAWVASARKEAVDGLRTINETAARTEKAIAEIDGRTRKTAAILETAIDLAEGGPIKRAARRSSIKAVRGTRKFVLRPGRRALRKGRRVAAPAASGVVKQLPPPARLQLRRARNLVRRGIDEPGPTAERVVRKLAPRVRAAAQQLPAPAQQSLRRTRKRFLVARRDPVAAAEKVRRRLPPPAQKFATRAFHAAERLQGRTARDEAEPTPKAAPAPKGPALRHWKEPYEEMVAAAVPEGARWLVVTPGSPKEARDARSTRGTSFPDTRKGEPFADDLSHIAHLEALRVAGHRYLVLPEGSVPWFRRQAELRDHVVRTYRTAADVEGAGAVFDLTAPAVAGSRSLRGEVSRLAVGLAFAPAVLDWTDLDLAGELQGLATFRPPLGDRLPYIDDSVDVVVVDAAHDLDEARRVATLGVVSVARGASGVEVLGVDVRGVTEPPEHVVDPDRGAGSVPPAPRVLVWSSADATDVAWRTHLEARALAAGADLRIAPMPSPELPDDAARYDVIVMVEPNVLPLPGAIEAAAALAVADPGAAVAGKVLRADGTLESAGGMVFFDRSVGLIAHASPDVRAPWHEFVRPVCWAPGLVAASGALWSRVPVSDAASGRAFLREWCADVWAGGGAVVYQPTVAAVRVTGDGGEPSVPLHESAWQRVLDLRPPRPSELGDGAWRYLVAHDHVEACRG